MFLAYFCWNFHVILPGIGLIDRRVWRCRRLALSLDSKKVVVCLTIRNMYLCFLSSQSLTKCADEDVGLTNFTVHQESGSFLTFFGEEMALGKTLNHKWKPSV